MGEIAIILKVVDKVCGISGISAKGTLNVEVVQSFVKSGSQFSVPSSIESIRVFFDEPPEVIISWRKETASADRDAVSAKLSEAVRTVVGGLLLLPNVFAFSLASDTDVFDIK